MRRCARDDETVQAGAEQAVAQLLEQIVACHRSQLGDNVVGVYLHGSRATGDHGPNSALTTSSSSSEH